MGSCLGWLFFGTFMLAAKAVVAAAKGVWHLMMWALQAISGVPLHYCKQEYLIPAKLLGAVGIWTLASAPLVAISYSGAGHKDVPGLVVVATLAAGCGLVALSRFLIRRGSI